MTAAVRPDRRRLVEALGLGPVWRLREGRPPGDGDGHADASPNDAVAARREPAALLEWGPLQDAFTDCVACDRSASRRHAVHGAGSSRPRWLVVGRASAADEDALGEAFVGEESRLLDAMLAASGLSRARDAFVMHLPRYRLPVEREPLAVDVACCRPYLERQIALLAPRLVLVVGEATGAALLGIDPGTDALRGREHPLVVEGRTMPVVVTVHPADLLRSPERKAEAWADLCLARSIEEEALAAASM